MRARVKMVGKWLVVLPLFVDFNKVISQPITEESNLRRARRLDLEDCCPCRDENGLIHDGFGTTSTSISSLDCPCPRSSDAEASASMLLPALRALQPFVKQSDQKTEPKPLLQPEVGLASSVLETLRQATDEEYQDALARNAARSAVKVNEPDLPLLRDTLNETPTNVVKIYLNPNGDDMDDNLPEPSHIQETRCIHLPLESSHKIGQLRMRRPTPVIEVINSPRKPIKTLRNKSLLHKKIHEMDSGIGASNIQERIIKPNTDNNLQGISLKSTPKLLSLFPKNNADDSNESIKDAGKNKDDEITKIKQNVKPKTSYKLKDLINSLDVNSNKEKPKLPVIDLKKYFETTTQFPSIIYKPLEKSRFGANRPLQLKDLLKLKDVELIPRSKSKNNKPNVDNSNMDSDNLNLKLRMSSKKNNDDDEKYVNCEYEDINTAPSMNRDVIITDSETKDETNSELVFNSENNKSLENSNNGGMDRITEECINSVNSNSNTISSTPLDNERQESYDEYDIQSKYDRNTDLEYDELRDNEPSTENLKDGLNNNSLKNGNVQKSKSNDDTINEESISNSYQIELLEDLNLPVEFDNSSLIPEIDINDTDSINDMNDMKTNKNIVNDHVAETSNNDLQIIKQNGQYSSMPQAFSNNVLVDCISSDLSSDDSINNENILIDGETFENQSSENLRSLKTNLNLQNFQRTDDLNAVEKNKINPKNGKISKVADKNDASEVSFKDLQEMSNSLLSLSECGLLNDKSTNIKSYVNEDLGKLDDDNIEMANTVFSVEGPSLEDTNGLKSEEEEKEKNINTNIKTKTIEGNKILDQSFHEKKCKTSDGFKNLIDAENDHFLKTLDTSNRELNAEDSEPDSNSLIYSNLKLQEPKISLFRNNINDITKSNIITKPIIDITNISQDNKQLNILDSLKSKMENLFSTTEKVTRSDSFTDSEDNVNESSNIKPNIRKFDGLINSNQFQRTPQTLRETLLPSIPGLTISSYKNKLEVPKSLDSTINLDQALNNRISSLSSAFTQNLRNPFSSPLENIETLGSKLLTSKSQNFLNSPIELTRPFEDVWDPSSALTDLSDRLRSHTENAIQNVKDTLETRLKESQTASFRRPSETVDTNDILQSISDRRDEFNEKLHAIHSDINDRFSTFQQTILDQFSQMSSINSELDDISKTGLKSSYIPINKQSSLLEASRPRTTSNKQNLKNVLPLSALEKSESVDKSVRSEVPGVSRFVNSNEFTSDFNHNIDSLRNGKLFETHKFPKIKNILSKSNDDRKLLLEKTEFSSMPTVKPSLIPTRKTLNAIVDTVPNMNADTSLSTKHSKIPVPIGRNLAKNRLILNPESLSNLAEERKSSPSHSLPPRINLTEKHFKMGSTEITSSQEDSSKMPHMNKLRKTPLQRNLDLKSRNVIKMPTRHYSDKDDDGKTRLRSYKNGKILGKSNDHDTRHSASQNVDNFRLVEPLKENVPYKCKLICYKDSDRK